MIGSTTHDPDAHDDVELGELENDAFLPDEATAKPKAYPENIFTKWIPQKIRSFFYNISKIWVCAFSPKFGRADKVT